jgi:fumarate reductase subunit D
MIVAFIEGLLSPTHLLILVLIVVIMWCRLARQQGGRDR